MNWTIIIAAQAEKQLRKLSVKDYKRIRQSIDDMEENPFFGDIDKLSGKENNWRKRTGKYRIFYEIFEDRRIIYISEIKRRTSSTY